MATYLSPAARLLCSPRQRSSRSTSSTGFPHGVYSLQSKVVWRWHHIQLDMVPEPSAERASPVTGPRREDTGYTQCKLFKTTLITERREPQDIVKVQDHMLTYQQSPGGPPFLVWTGRKKHNSQDAKPSPAGCARQCEQTGRSRSIWHMWLESGNEHSPLRLSPSTWLCMMQVHCSEQIEPMNWAH